MFEIVVFIYAVTIPFVLVAMAPYARHDLIHGNNGYKYTKISILEVYLYLIIFAPIIVLVFSILHFWDKLDEKFPT